MEYRPVPLSQGSTGPIDTVQVLSGTVVIRDICKRKSVGEYSYFPYVAQMCCTALWDTYAVINWQDGKMFWPLTVNLFGLSVSTTIFAIYVTFATPKEKKAILANAGPPLGAVAAFDWYALHHPSEPELKIRSVRDRTIRSSNHSNHSNHSNSFKIGIFSRKFQKISTFSKLSAKFRQISSKSEQKSVKRIQK